MDKTKEKIVFLIVFIIPVFLVLVLAWFLLGNKIINSPIAFGYLNGISAMVIPTVILVVLGLSIRYFFFRK